MRTGVTASSIAHVAVIVVALIGFNHASQLTPDAEQSIAVDLVPVAPTSSVRAGSEKSKIIDTTTPSVVEDSKPVVPAQPTGNTPQDQPKPTEANVPTPAPTQNSAPAPAPQPQPQPVTPAQPPAQPPAPQPAPQPAPTPPPTPEPKPQAAPPTSAAADQQLATDASASMDTAPPVPTPTPQSDSLAQKRADLQKQQEAAAKAAAEAAAKAAAEAKAKADAAAKAAADAKAKAVADAKAKAAADALDKLVADAAAAQAKKEADAKKQALAEQAQSAAKVADEISSLINNEKTTGAKTGQGGTPTAGKATGKAAALTRGEMDAFSAQVRQCFHLLPNEIESGLGAHLLVNMNADGTVVGTPQITAADPSSIGQSIARAGQRAVLECGPYNKILPAAKFAEWKQIDLELDP